MFCSVSFVVCCAVLCRALRTIAFTFEERKRVESRESRRRCIPRILLFSVQYLYPFEDFEPYVPGDTTSTPTYYYVNTYCCTMCQRYEQIIYIYCTYENMNIIRVQCCGTDAVAVSSTASVSSADVFSVVLKILNLTSQVHDLPLQELPSAAKCCQVLL